MKYLIKLKPYQQVLMFFVALFAGFFVSIPIDRYLSHRFEYLFFIAPTIFFMLPIALWFYYIGYALDFIDNKNGNSREYNKYKIAVGSILFAAITLPITTNYFSIIHKCSTPILINLAITIIYISGFIYTINFITKRFAIYYSKRAVKVSDYIGYTLIICFAPFGIAIIQSQIRTIINDENIEIQ